MEESENKNEAELVAAIATRSKGWLNRTVVGAGITSALGDFCYETTTVILPGFLAVLGLPASVLGTIEGIADAVASFTKMASGYGALGTVNGTAKFISSAMVGVVWTAVSPALGFGLAAFLMAAGTLALLRVGNE